jgi:hypothetical protein
MPTPAVTLKIRKFRRRFGIAAPRVVVRTHLSWPWYAGGVALILLLFLVIIWLFLQRGETGSMERELDALRTQVRDLDGELLRLRSTAGTEQSAVQMERSTQQQLTSRIKVLELENIALKEDMRLFERLLPLAGNETVIRLESFRVVPDGPQRYHYRALLAFQSGKRAPEFRGRLQILVVFSAAGKRQEMLLPVKREDAEGFQLEVRNFLRKEGAFEIPAGSKLESVEARVLQGDTLKTRRMAQL